MTKSALTDFSIMSPNHYSGRSYSVTRVTVHHMAGNLSAEQCGYVFQSTSRQASSNYGIGSDGEIAMYVDEDDAAWTSSSYDNDNRAITIEVADYDCVNWIPTQAAYNSCVALCADICQRYGITPSYTGDTRGTFTEHMMFAATGCPGPWWHDHMGQFVEDVKNYMEGDFDMSTASDVWEYNWNDTAPMGNMYNCVIAQYKAIADLLNKVNALTTKVNTLSAKVDKITTGGVDTAAVATAVVAKMDYSKMAKSVNDDAAKRMQA